MLKCRDITLLASDYVDGRLRWRKRFTLLVHLMMCPHCRRFISQFRAVVRIIRGHAPPPVAPSVINRFEMAIDDTLDHNGRPRAEE